MLMVTQDGNSFWDGYGVLIYTSKRVTNDFDLEGAMLARREFLKNMREVKHIKGPIAFVRPMGDDIREVHQQ